MEWVKLDLVCISIMTSTNTCMTDYPQSECVQVTTSYNFSEITDISEMEQDKDTVTMED